MKKIRHIIEFCLLVCFNLVVLLLPLRMALWIGCWLGDIAFYILEIRKEVIIKNLTFAFPNKNQNEILEIARRTYQYFGMSMIELLSFPKLQLKKFADKNIDYEGLEYLDEIANQKQGTVLIAGHFGSWELMGAVLCQKGYPIDFLVGKQHNNYADNLLNFYRRLKGIGIIPLNLALKGVLRAISKGRFVAMLSDQDAGKRDGVFVNFFGRDASTPKGPAVFALRTETPIYMGFCIRQQPFYRHKIKFVKVDYKKTDNSEQDIHLLTTKYTQVLEGFIKKYPEQWFWFHKRWKTTVDNTPNMY
ncbi:MAG: lysophospholipid acyltransferase family protein [Elusimicrobiota bacterium]